MHAVLIKQQILNTFILEHSHASFRYITNLFLFFFESSFLQLKEKRITSKVLFENKTPAKHRDIFRDTLIAKKLWRRRGSNPRPTGWKTKKIQARARVRTQDLQPD